MMTIARVILPVLLLAALIPGHTQDGNLRIASMGGDSVDCGVYLSTYREFLKLEYYDNAMEPWQQAFENCPESSLRMYTDGVKLYRRLIEQEPAGPVREGLIDTLMLIYDRRIENFGDPGNVLGRKGTDLLAYRGDDLDQVQIAYGLLDRSIEIEGKNSREPVLQLYLTAGILLAGDNRLEGHEVLEDYLMLSSLVDELAEGRSRWARTGEKLDELMLRAGLFDCEVLDGFYLARLEQNFMEESDLRNAISIYQSAACKRSDGYAAISEQLYNLDQDPVLAHTLGILYISREDNEKAAGYLMAAVQGEGIDEETLASWYYELALVKYALSEPCSAIEYARRAIGLKEDLSSAYILLGDAFIASRNSLEDEFQQRAVYWAATDQYRTAVRVDPSAGEEAEKKLSSSLSQYPDQEDVFFQDLEDGQSYRVGGCINESTTVRYGQ